MSDAILKLRDIKIYTMANVKKMLNEALASNKDYIKEEKKRRMYGD